MCETYICECVEQTIAPLAALLVRYAAGVDSYLERMADALLGEVLHSAPAVIVTGARASGKTTTAMRYAATTVRFDNPNEAAAFEVDHDAALNGRPEPVLFDEWQVCPAVVGAVKRAVDSERRPGRFILTGSARFDANPALWPGTGRLIRIAMAPMTVREQLRRPQRYFLSRLIQPDRVVKRAVDPPDLRGYVELALRGGFPEPALELTGVARREWLSSYLSQLLVHDRATTGSGPDPSRLGTYFEEYALNSAGVVNDTTLATAAGVDRRTAQSYARLLADLGVVNELPAWSTNRLKRLAKMPKRLVADSGLLGAAIGADEAFAMSNGDVLGRMIETFVVNQVLAEAPFDPLRPRWYHLRAQDGRREVDLVADLGVRGIVGVEVKAHSAPKRDHARHLMWLRDTMGERFIAGAVLHTGPDHFMLAERIEAVPIWTLWD